MYTLLISKKGVKVIILCRQVMFAVIHVQVTVLCIQRLCYIMDFFHLVHIQTEFIHEYEIIHIE